MSLTQVEQQRSVRLLGACSDPDPGAVRNRSQADRLGAGGAQSSSQLPGRRPPVDEEKSVTSSVTRRTLYNEGNRPPTAGSDECKGDVSITAIADARLSLCHDLNRQGRPGRAIAFAPNPSAVRAPCQPAGTASAA